jgi:hypothetical protein
MVLKLLEAAAGAGDMMYVDETGPLHRFFSLGESSWT